MFNWLWNRSGKGLGTVVVLTMFVGVPVAVWAISWPMLSSLPLEPVYQRTLVFAVLGTVAVGLVTGLIVLRDLHDEPV